MAYTVKYANIANKNILRLDICAHYKFNEKGQFETL